MNKKQYNNVIDYTLKHEPSAQTDDSLATARVIFDNMGVALPQGDLAEICEVLKTNNYMGWKSCTIQEAQAAADKGTAAIGISNERIVVLSATDEEEPVAETSSVMALSENTSAYAVADLAYYSYSYGSTTSTAPMPHGNYLTFTCTQPAVCNDGIGAGYDDPYHQSQTSYMNGVLNADIHRYIVIPQSVSGYATLRGCVGVAVRSDGRYLCGVVGEVGPELDDPNLLNEFSVKMIQDLGFDTDGAKYVDPADVVTTYIFPDTKRSSWPSSTLNDDVECVGRNYFY